MPKPPRMRRFPWSGRWNGAIGALTLAIVVSACSLIEIEDAPLSAVEPRGPFAEQINNLFWPVFWVAVAIFVLVQGGILFSIIAFRDRPGRKEPKQIHGNTKLEITWTVIPALILAAIAVPTVSTVFDLTECGDEGCRLLGLFAFADG